MKRSCTNNRAMPRKHLRFQLSLQAIHISKRERSAPYLRHANDMAWRHIKLLPPPPPPTTPTIYMFVCLWWWWWSGLHELSRHLACVSSRRGQSLEQRSFALVDGPQCSIVTFAPFGVFRTCKERKATRPPTTTPHSPRTTHTHTQLNTRTEHHTHTHTPKNTIDRLEHTSVPSKNVFFKTSTKCELSRGVEPAVPLLEREVGEGVPQLMRGLLLD